LLDIVHTSLSLTNAMRVPSGENSGSLPRASTAVSEYPVLVATSMRIPSGVA
jgi:hypothetical protein